MYLLATPFVDTELHAHVGSPITFGITLAPVTPAVADRYTRIISAKVVDASTATTHLVKSIRSEVGELTIARRDLEDRVTVAKNQLEEAHRLASMPVCGDEAATINAYSDEIRSLLETPVPTASRSERLQRFLHLAIGLDMPVITAALEDLDKEKTAIGAARASLTAIRQGLLEAARVAADPATLAGVAKIKANARLVRALTPERVAGLEQLLATVRSKLTDIESEVATLAKAVR